MSRIYFAWIKEMMDQGGVYISAPNLREAKKIAYTSDVFDSWDDRYIDLRCHAVHNKDRSFKKTGLLTGEMHGNALLIQEGCHWWECERCGQDDRFESIGGGYPREDHYRCPKCGYIGEIPYEI